MEQKVLEHIKKYEGQYEKIAMYSLGLDLVLRIKATEGDFNWRNRNIKTLYNRNGSLKLI